MTEESSTEPPWIQMTGGFRGSPASRQWMRAPLGSRVSGRREAPLDVPRVAGHGGGADPVHDGDEEVELEGTHLAIGHDLRGTGQIHEADDGGEGGVLEEHDELSLQGGDHVLERLG